MPGAHFPSRCPHTNVVAKPAVFIPRSGEDLQWDREIAQDNSVIGKHGDAMRRLPNAAWLESCDDCLSGHWFDYDGVPRIDEGGTHVCIAIGSDELHRTGPGSRSLHR